MKRQVALAVALSTWMCAAAAAAAPASPGLVGDWNFDEGSGTVAHDIAGVANDGVLSGAVTWIPGQSGSAVSFNGSHGQVLVSNSSSLEPTTAVTVSAWVEHLGSPGAFRYILAKGATGCIAASYGLYTGPGGGLQFYVSRVHGTTYARSPDDGTGIWDGHWHLAVGTFDGTTVRLYVDGTEVGSGTSYPGSIEYLLPSSNDLYFGNYPGCENHEFVGGIDEIRIWNRALSAGEVASLASGAGSGGSSGTTGGSTGGSTGGTNGGSTGGSTNGNSGSSGTTGTSGHSHGTSAPLIGRLRLSPSKLSAGALARRPRQHGGRAIMISYTDTQAARSTLTVLHSAVGVRHGTTCVAPRPGGSHRRAVRCTRWTALGSFAHTDHAGVNSFVFAWLQGHRLTPGSYHLQVTPKRSGVTGASATAVFTLMR